MKAFNLIAKIIAALAAIAGVVYVIATYGDKIVAWCKSVLPTVEVEIDTTEESEEDIEDAEEAAEEAEEATEEVEEVVEEIVEETVVADEADFEG